MKAASSRFYRYQGFSARTVDSLCRDELYFASLADFNDPFDCKPVVELDSNTAALREVLLLLVAARVSSETQNALAAAKLKSDKAVAYARRSGEHEAADKLADIAYNATNPDYDCSKEDAERRLLAASIERELLRQYDKGVCCFSESFNNMLLWSHYGDQHRGLCVGYGLDRKPKPKMQRVLYGGTRTVKSSLIAKAIVDKDEPASAALDEHVLLRKAPEWRYEKEWRLLGARGVQDSCLLLTDVTFGLRCSEAIKHALISALGSRAPKVDFYEIRNARGTFRLRRAEVDLDEMARSFPRTAESGIEMFGDPDPD
jgi:Protein of unknown function (DUF2971)